MPKAAAASRNNKRQRTDPIGAAGAASPVDNALQSIGSLPAQTVCNMLAQAARKYPDVAVSIVNERKKLLAAEHARTTDFDSYSKHAWRAMHVGHSRLSGSQQFEKASDVASEVEGYIDTIGEATKQYSNFDTKKSALETLRKIGKSIILTPDTLGREVRIEFQYNNCLEDTMLRIAKSMTVAERRTLMTEEFEDKLVELEKQSTDYFIFENLKDVRLALLSCHGENEYDEEEDGQSEDEDDDE